MWHVICIASLRKIGIYYIIMRQIYYVIRTLLRGRSSNVVKVISLGLGLTMSILLFARVAFEQSFDKCFKDYDNLYQVFSIFTMNGEQLEPQDQNCGPVAGAILENFPKEVEAATSYCLGCTILFIMGVSVLKPESWRPIPSFSRQWESKC